MNYSKTGHRMLEVAQQLAAAGVPVFPCTSNKKPAVPQGTHWGTVAAMTPPDQINWPSAVIGIPIPAGVAVIDLDTYKGVTRQSVEQAIGCALPWDEALIQHTQHGGEHYAFAVDWEVKQGSELFNIDGFDTRTAGKGYICTGGGYPWAGFGPLRMSQPATMLPRLPDAARPVLERVPHVVKTAELPQGDRDVDLIREALRHIDADCPRTEWVATGMALKHHFHDAQDTGFALFKEWSEYAADRLDYETLEPQWNSFKPFSSDGASITIATVIYKAMQAGWQPPADVDTALAFGEGAATVQTFGALIDLITESGGDPKMTADIIEAIKHTPSSDVQRATLLATLHRELKEAGLLTKQVKAALDTALTGIQAPAEGVRNAPGRYGKNHAQNAKLFINTCYPDGLLLRSDEVWYVYTGKCWEEQEDSAMETILTYAMLDSDPMSSTIKGTLTVVTSLCRTPDKIGGVDPNLIIYANGVLDTRTWQMSSHRKELFTTNILPYDYIPNAQCPRWGQFLDEVFDGDIERIALLQEWLGYLLSPSRRHHKMLMLIGPPRSGKGTIGRILRHVVGGQNYAAGNLSLFAKDSFLDALRTKPVLFVSDAETKMHPSVLGAVIERLKTISGNDEINFTRKFKSNISETLPCRITMGANGIPRLFDDSGALASRFMLLTMDRSFIDNGDNFLDEALIAEIEGIAAWALAGLGRLNGTGKFTVPSASVDETQYLKEAYSPLRLFIDDICEQVDGSHTTTADLYLAYKVWALGQGDDILLRKVFTGAFKDATRGQFIYAREIIDGTYLRVFKDVRLRTAVPTSNTAAAFEVVK